MNFKNKTVVVTGANGGMGKVITERFLKEGAKVAALDLHVDELEVGKEDYLSQLLAIPANLTDEKQVTNAIQQAADFLGGRISILVNTLGIAQSATPIEEVTLDEWDKLMAVNMTSLFLVNKEVVKVMKTKGSGAITNIASIAAERPRPGLNAYVTSKGGAISFTKALAIELAEFNIRVNAINPGPSDTNMLGKFSPLGGDVNKVKEETFKQSVPLGQLVMPEDIAEAVLYLSSDQAKMVTGSVLNVDGGRGL
ncbi:3-oxoacyl-[acyl-carrier protein] reductase [Halobacillus karajensis]|uniref:SDR family NAD(P)-dependent oxidoreductase n=1 Tax=Halobacillus karajensis TaxID=195088 RepID=UPI0008A7D160|nr:glucose 1-dehydrogenase [Halobacillus karajensis]SEH41270.1 3-oxoacyl-[acyl-carrier protein] reductase [Halobacillus karajensis]